MLSRHPPEISRKHRRDHGAHVVRFAEASKCSNSGDLVSDPRILFVGVAADASAGGARRDGVDADRAAAEFFGRTLPSRSTTTARRFCTGTRRACRVTRTMLAYECGGKATSKSLTDPVVKYLPAEVGKHGDTIKEVTPPAYYHYRQRCCCRCSRSRRGWLPNWR